MTAALNFTNVSKNFSRKGQTVRALNNISFSIDDGEVFGFIGPNGAGKSTTIKVMLDVINRYKGKVEIYGVDARNENARSGIAYVPESPALYEQFTPLEILLMVMNMYGIHKPDNKKWCMQYLEKLSIDHVAKRRIRDLSKGTVQRTSIAAALCVSPKLLILDEPLSGLDPVGRKDVIELLMEFKLNGGAIFFTSHVLYDVERIADRFGFINNGKLLTTRSPKELLNEHKDRFIVRYQSLNPISGREQQLRDGEFELEVTQAQLPDWLNTLNDNCCKLLDIRSAISLETVFFKILESEHDKDAQ